MQSYHFMRLEKIKVLLVISIILTGLSAIVTYFAVIESKKQVDLVLHSYEVLHHNSDILSSLNAAESGVRAYMITADSVWLDHYVYMKETYISKLLELKSLTNNDDYERNIIQSEIEPYIKYKVEQLGIVALIAKTSGLDSAKRYSSQRKNKLSLDNLRVSIKAFNKYEEIKIDERLTSLNKTLDKQNKTRYVSFLLIGLTLVLAFITITKKQKINDELIRQLNESNATLEQKVSTRTQEIEQKNSVVVYLNTQLQQSIEEIQSFNESLQIRNQKTEENLFEINDLYNNALCGYHSLDKNGVFVRINDLELKWLGYSRNEVIGKLSFADIATPQSYLFFKKIYPQYIKTGESKNLEFEFIRKDKTTFHVLLNSKAIYDAGGNFIMGRTTIFDITSLKVLEHQLINANNALLQLNEEKNHILSIAAHDLKTPLNHILGIASVWLMEEDTLSETQKEYLRFINDSCKRMKNLIENLLDIDRIELGLKTVHVVVFNFNELTQKLHHSFLGEAKKKKINLILQDTTTITHYSTDPEMLYRVLENLVSNAIKFSPSGKNVLLSTKQIGKKLTIEITDEGPGIIADELPLLFVKFKKLSARPTAGENSSGLGLSIVKELVELMGGTIEVKTKLNEGTSFVVELPIT